MTVASAAPEARTQQVRLSTLRESQLSQEVPEHSAASSSQTIPNDRFPLGYKEAAAQWWTSLSSKQAERNVLSLIPYLREASASSAQNGDVAMSDTFGVRRWRSAMVQLAGKNRALNEFSVERVGEPVTESLVMLHGYGAGLGFFYKNFEPLSRIPGWRLYALDMLGMGNSSRPPFRIQAKDPQGKIREAEDWFVDSLEEWRKIKKIDKFTLLGHSMGGYLAVSYALKYPGHLNKLILASPVGIPENPYAVDADMPEPGDSTVANEIIQDQESIVQRKGSGQSTQTTPQKKPLNKWFVWLWDANVSPFSIIRLAGPLGPRFVSGWSFRRFNHLPPEEKEALHAYSYSLFRQRGSGEYALPYILAPGAYARSPIIHKIEDVGRQVIKPATETTPAIRETGYPILFLYGDKDWMDINGAYDSEKKLEQRKAQALLTDTEEEKRKENGCAKVVKISGAGHHLYLDNPDAFNALLQKEMLETKEYNKKQTILR